MNWKIPLFKTYWDEADVASVSASIRRGMYWAEGPYIEQFEAALSNYMQQPGVLVCNSGTSALHLALIASGIKHFHEVIVPSFTFQATVNAVHFVGAAPVFADIELQTFGLDPEDVERKITPKTKAIIAVHYAGCPCLIHELQSIALRHNLILIEDAAEALGATVNGIPVGSLSDCAIFSFCSNKIISTGEGGALVTSNKYIYDRARLARSHGQSEGSVGTTDAPSFSTLGYNFRMSDMVAALGVSQLAKIEQIITQRRLIVARYGAELDDVENIELSHVPKGYRHVHQLYTIRFRNGKRDKVKQHLADNGIMSKVYFYPVHLSDYYRKQSWATPHLLTTEQVSSEVLSLPIYPGLTEAEITLICDKVKEAIE